MSEERMLVKRLATPTTAPKGENDSEKTYCWQESETADSATYISLIVLVRAYVALRRFGVSRSL